MSMAMDIKEFSAPAPRSRPRFSDSDIHDSLRLAEITDAHREGRVWMRTHAIDDLDPEIADDRDDGIFVELQPHANGGYRVHVTIADIAAYVDASSQLAKIAFARGNSRYGPNWIDPMFPRPFELLVSLEHQQERLGFTVSIDLDAQFRPTLTSFQPTITKAENMSYAQATQRMRSDSQIGTMAQVAAGLRRYFLSSKGSKDWLHDGALRRSHHLPLPDPSGDSIDMVATYMLLTNHCTAEFFSRSRLPYIFRNFNQHETAARARFAIESEGHDALNSDKGLKGAYGFFTSPIRRAVDLANLYMAHFAYEALRDLETALAPYNRTDCDLHSIVWQHGPDILRLCANDRTSPRERLDARNTIKGIVQTMGHDEDFAKRLSIELASSLAGYKLPLSAKEVQKYADHSNMLAGTPDTRILAKQRDDFEALQSMQSTHLGQLDKNALSSMLIKAAKLGELPENLFREISTRIEENKYDPVADGFSILVLAARPEVPEWNTLKRAILRKIKHDPQTVNGILAKTQDLYKDSMREIALDLSNNPDAHTGARERDHGDVWTAILTLKRDDIGSLVAAPYYSVGHNKRAAISHAQYALLEHLAFGELQPVEQTSIPDLLYVETDSTNMSKRTLVEKMVSQAKGKLRGQAIAGHAEPGYRIDVSGGSFTTPILIEAFGATPQAAELSALRHLLRDPRFKYKVAPKLEVYSLMYPQKVLAEYLVEQGYTRQEQVVIPRRNSFEIEIPIIIDGETRVFSGSGPNKDRAERAATVDALHFFGISLDQDNRPAAAQSWATDSYSGAAIGPVMPLRPMAQETAAAVMHHV